MKATRNLWHERAHRARFLADTYPASREILSFYARLAFWQSRAATEVQGFRDLPGAAGSLLDMVRSAGPPALARAAERVEPGEIEVLLREYWESPLALRTREFFARALLEMYAAILPEGIDCPWCALPPQAGCLRSQGDGLALELVCALCFRRRPHPRGCCPNCGESSESTKLAGYTTPALPHLRLMACDACKGYLILVDLSADFKAIPEVDELAGLPLDLWAAGQGYRKLQPNIAGV